MDLSLIFQHKLIISLLAGVLSIAYAIFLAFRVLSNERGDEKMNAISDAIAEGAMAYMKRQYTVVAIIGVLIAVILYFAFGLITAGGFVVGAVFSAVAGVIGMSVAVRSNIRTAQAAKKGLAAAFDLAFKGGAVTGLMVAGLALVAVSGRLPARSLPNCACGTASSIANTAKPFNCMAQMYHNARATSRTRRRRPNNPTTPVGGSTTFYKDEDGLVDLIGIEPMTSSMPWKRAPSCATGPHREGYNSPIVSAVHSIRQTRHFPALCPSHGLASADRHPHFQPSLLQRVIKITCHQALS